MSGAKGLAADFSPEMEKLVRQFYFKRCLMHFHSTRNQSYAVALSSIPFVNTWDDHDIFDGFGSYDDDIQVSWVCVSVCVCVLWNLCLCVVEYVSVCCGSRIVQNLCLSSHAPWSQACKVMRGIFTCARDVFCLFQLHVTFAERTHPTPSSTVFL